MGIFYSPLYSINYQITYIHLPLQHFSQDYDLASHTTYVLCVNFIREWRDLQFNVDSERQIFWEKFSWQVYVLYCFCQKSAERKSLKKYFSYFIFHDLEYELRLLRLIITNWATKIFKLNDANITENYHWTPISLAFVKVSEAHLYVIGSSLKHIHT